MEDWPTEEDFDISSFELLQLEQAYEAAKRKTEHLFRIYRSAKATRDQPARSTDSEAHTSRSTRRTSTRSYSRRQRQDDDQLSSGSGEGLLLAVNKFLSSKELQNR